jgi:hypothetical protein
LVDGFDQSQLAGEQVHGADAPIGQAVGALADFIMDIAGGEQGLGTAAQVARVEPTLQAALAVGQFLSYLGIHSKSLRCSGHENLAILIRLGKCRRISSFFMNFGLNGRGLRLFRA